MPEGQQPDARSRTARILLCGKQVECQQAFLKSLVDPKVASEMLSQRVFKKSHGSKGGIGNAIPESF